MIKTIARSLFCWLLLDHCVSAQTVIRNSESLAPDRPEAWAMNYIAASTLMTDFGENMLLPSGNWGVAMELAMIPHLSPAQRLVGFDGTKEEDLNKSPIFGRLRLSLGLPAGWVAELGYTPPVTINGVRPRNLVALAIGHRIFDRDDWTLSMRGFGQHGSIQGDITCPKRLAGIVDFQRNPYGCQAASRDKIDLNYFGVNLTAEWNRGGWPWHATVGVMRTELLTQVDALVYDQRDNSRLVAHDVLPYVAIGVGRQLGKSLALTAEVLYVPLSVVRAPVIGRQTDSFAGLRLMLRYPVE